MADVGVTTNSTKGEATKTDLTELCSAIPVRPVAIGALHISLAKHSAHKLERRRWSEYMMWDETAKRGMMYQPEYIRVRVGVAGAVAADLLAAGVPATVMLGSSSCTVGVVVEVAVVAQ